MLKMYGIKNCDTVKKAMKFLEANGAEFSFVDLKKECPSDDLLKSWKSSLGEWPVNRRGRTFRQFSEEFDAASDSEKIKLIQENTSLIRRPVLVKGKKILCMGFDKDIYDSLV